MFTLVNATVNGEAQDPSDVFNVGIKKGSDPSKDFIYNALKKAQKGQRIGFKFEKLIPATVKGYKDTKSIKPFIWEMDPDYTPQEDMGTDEPDISDRPF